MVARERGGGGKETSENKRRRLFIVFSVGTLFVVSSLLINASIRKGLDNPNDESVKYVYMCCFAGPIERYDMICMIAHTLED